MGGSEGVVGGSEVIVSGQRGDSEGVVGVAR